MAGFEREMAAQRERARAHSRFGAMTTHETSWESVAATQFDGYERLEEEATVVALFRAGQVVEALNAGEEGVAVLDHTPFYAESGGQVGDTGWLRADGVEFVVSDTRKQGEGVFTHIGVVKQGPLRRGAMVLAQVDAAQRQATALHHSATHLMHAALRQVLGTHVTQKGSLVDPQRLRFDFAHFEPVTPKQLEAVERLVNAQIRGNVAVETTIMAPEEAIAAGAMALFGEKYGHRVRVLRMGDFSTELCGGTHVRRVGDIGLFKIVAESGVAAGVRRIEAVTGERGAGLHRCTGRSAAKQAAFLVKGDRDNFPDKVRQLVERSRQLEKEIEQLKGRLASGQGADLLSQTVTSTVSKVLAARLDGVDAKTLREAVDRCKEH